MGAIVLGIILFVLGAICRWALEIPIPGLEPSTLGTILMVTGAILFLVGVVLAARSRRAVVATRRDAIGTVSCPSGETFRRSSDPAPGRVPDVRPRRCLHSACTGARAAAPHAQTVSRRAQ